jgi:hypothetical protein
VNPASRVHQRLAEMAGVELGWRVVAGELLAWGVTGLALVMSYHAEEDLGQSLSAFHGWPAYVWPLSVDVADGCCTWSTSACACPPGRCGWGWWPPRR